MGVKSVGTFPVILLKLATPSPPTPNKVEFGAKWVKLSTFLATTLLGGVGERRDEPKAEQKIEKLSLGTESYGTIAWKGFYTQSQVLLSSIVDTKKSIAMKGYVTLVQVTKLKMKVISY